MCEVIVIYVDGCYQEGSNCIIMYSFYSNAFKFID